MVIAMAKERRILVKVLVYVVFQGNPELYLHL